MQALSDTEDGHYNDYNAGIASVNDVPRTPAEQKLQFNIPTINGARNITEFHILNRVEEGTYGVVFKAQDKKNGKMVALKRLKLTTSRDGFPIHYLREIKILSMLHHPNIIQLQEVVVSSSVEPVYLVMEFIELDLKTRMDTMRENKHSFSFQDVKMLIEQVLRGLCYLHANWILHRDLKPSNLLLSSHGLLKIADFGLAREYGSPLLKFTPGVVSLWYRAPELLLKATNYSTAIDVWSGGCIFAEMILMSPLFEGNSEINQLSLIHKTLGSPTETELPGSKFISMGRNDGLKQYFSCMLDKCSPGRKLSDAGLELMQSCLYYDPSKRITCEDAMSSEYFVKSSMVIRSSPNFLDYSDDGRWYDGGYQSRIDQDSWHLRF